MAYKAAVDANGTVIAIGLDEGQLGAYGKVGTWQDFSFETMPEIPADLKADMDAKAMAGHIPMPVYKVNAGAVEAITLAAAQAMEAANGYP